MAGLLIGYVFSIFAKADPSMFTGYAGTLFAILTAYIWGNQRVHQFQGKPQ